MLKNSTSESVLSGAPADFAVLINPLLEPVTAEESDGDREVEEEATVPELNEEDVIVPEPNEDIWFEVFR